MTGLQDDAEIARRSLIASALGNLSLVRGIKDPDAFAYNSRRRFVRHAASREAIYARLYGRFRRSYAFRVSSN
jgi:hypothetical protein